MKKFASSAPYFLSILSLGLFSALIGPSLPGLAENTGAALDRISLIFILNSLGYLLGSLLGGRAYDRIPGHRILSLSLLGLFLSGALIPLSGQLFWLLVTLFTLGLAQGVIDVGCNTLLLWAHDQESGPYINGLHFFFGVGSSLSPLILAGVLSLAGGIQWAYWIISLSCLPLAIWLWFLPGPPAPPETRGLKTRQPVPIVPVAVLALAFTLYVGAEVGFGSWIYTYGLKLGLGTEITAAYLTSAFWGIFTLGRLAGIWISTKIRPQTVLVIDLLGCIFSLSLLPLFPGSRTALWIGTIGTGLFMASVFPNILLLGRERLTITGAVTGWFLVGSGLGGMILPWAIGLAFTGIGASALPGFVLSAISLDLVIILLFSRRSFPAAS